VVVARGRKPLLNVASNVIVGMKGPKIMSSKRAGKNESPGGLREELMRLELDVPQYLQMIEREKSVAAARRTNRLLIEAGKERR